MFDLYTLFDCMYYGLWGASAHTQTTLHQLPNCRYDTCQIQNISAEFKDFLEKNNDLLQFMKTFKTIILRICPHNSHINPYRILLMYDNLKESFALPVYQIAVLTYYSLLLNPESESRRHISTDKSYNF